MAVDAGTLPPEDEPDPDPEPDETFVLPPLAEPVDPEAPEPPEEEPEAPGALDEPEPLEVVARFALGLDRSALVGAAAAALLAAVAPLAALASLELLAADAVVPARAVFASGADVPPPPPPPQAASNRLMASAQTVRCPAHRKTEGKTTSAFILTKAVISFVILIGQADDLSTKQACSVRCSACGGRASELRHALERAMWKEKRRR